MRSLLTGYAGAFNRRHKRSGHLFQNRYKSVVVEEEPYLLELVRYLHLNPLRAGIVSNLRVLANYGYCGHGALSGAIQAPWQDTNAVLQRFSRQLGRARTLYRVFVADGVACGRRPELVGGGLIRSAGGWKAVIALRRGREGYASDERILGDSEFVETIREEVEKAENARVRGRWHSLATIDLIKMVCVAEGIPMARLLGAGRARSVSRARQGIAFLWVEVLGNSGRALARDLNVRPESIYYAAKQGRKDAARWEAILEK
jgi:hypothetical protein